MTKLIIAVAVLLVLSPIGFAQISLSGTYSQNFDSMGTSGTAPPAGWSMYFGNSGTTASTWSTSIPGNGTNSVASMVVTTGDLTVNDNPTATRNNGYNATGPGGTSDRLIATSPTGFTGAAIQLSLNNVTGGALSSVQLSYDIHRFTTVSAVNELPGYWLFTSLDNGSTWTNFSPLNSTIESVPNTLGTTVVSTTTLTLGTPWATDTTLLIRWVDDNAFQTSPDQIIGLNNVVITPVPEPTSLFTIVSVASLAYRARRLLS